MNPGLLFRIVLVAAIISLPQGASAQDGKAAVLSAIDADRERAAKVALEIWDLAEVGYQETRSSALLQQQLRDAGFSVEAGVAGMPTAFVATYGSGKPVIGILAEFDALPGITQQATPERAPAPQKDAGHACGHHLFGTASTFAAIAVKSWLVASGTPGTIRVYGTPAEEGGAGKVKLMEAGVFRDVAAAMMIHPRCGTQVWRPSLGLMKAKVEYFGKAAHAASWPWRGVNALNAVIGLFNALDAMRQHLRPDARVHGVITVGGQQANIIPEYTAAEFYLRSLHKTYLQELRRRFEAAAEGAATATGCRVQVTVDPTIHDPLKPNATMAGLFERNLARIDFPVDPDDGQAGFGSTDAGNVSQAVPTIHPYIRTSPDGVPGHSREFAEHNATPVARAGMVAAAKALALTALDLLAEPDALEAARRDFGRTG